MKNIKRGIIQNQFFFIEIHECPIEVILFAAESGARNVTIENYRNHRNPEAVKLQILANGNQIAPGLKNLQADFSITQSQFASLADIWNSQGVYAVFHEADVLKFRASDLDDASRYKALLNFQWNLEIAVPDGSSGDWTRIVSPQEHIINRVAQYCESSLI
jgi:hypothetical protein